MQSEKRMRTKRKGQKATLNSVFENRIVNKYYNETLSGRPVVSETSLSKEAQDLIPSVNITVTRNQWSRLHIEPAQFMSKTLIWEFYAHAWFRGKDAKTYLSYVRGEEVPFDKGTIARLLNLPAYTQPTEYDLMKEEAEESFPFTAIKDALFLEGRDWFRNSDGEPRHVVQRNMKPLARFWAHYMFHNIMPNSHQTEVKPAQALLLMALVLGRTIDLADIIANEIHVTATRSTSGYLCFPWVITQLCDDAGVGFDLDLKELRRIPAMKHSNYTRYYTLANKEMQAIRTEAAPRRRQGVTNRGQLEELANDVRKIMKRQTRQISAAQFEMRRNQAREAEIQRITDHLGLTSELPPYSQEELEMLDTSSEEEEDEDAV